MIGALADPAPGRVPRVYNALITSNQNLEPSKAYPVYQPVLHDAFGFPFQPAVLYGGDLIGNGILPQPNLPPKESQSPKTSPSATPESPKDSSETSTESPAKTPEPEKPETDSNDSQPAPPVSPTTESPVILNAFGLPPQVLPLGHVNPVYNALPQFNPFTYHYPGLRFYDPYDPFSFSVPSIYRPLPNLLGPHISAGVPLAIANKKASTTPASSESTDQTPPPEPNDLSILNYSSKDPAIPNVPPPPLPQGGLKSDESES
ncbi:unnamed protein product [Arctia plantaginis]|nr:unnamed protein product [Arctia plantaginis]